MDIENGFNFECIHGPAECVGNNMMMCAKMIIPTVEQYMGFSNCIMEKFEGAGMGQVVRAILYKKKKRSIIHCYIFITIISFILLNIIIVIIFSYIHEIKSVQIATSNEVYKNKRRKSE